VSRFLLFGLPYFFSPLVTYTPAIQGHQPLMDFGFGGTRGLSLGYRFYLLILGESVNATLQR
jgi:hypothetical protein